MRLLAASSFIGLMLVSEPGLARMSFVNHEGASEVVHGEGGKRLVSHGVEVWTSGMPTRQFRVVGTVMDVRTDRFFAGKLVQSTALAKLVRQHGGDAVLIRKVATQKIGVMPQQFSGPIGTVAFDYSKEVPINSVLTIAAVIKYL